MLEPLKDIDTVIVLKPEFWIAGADRMGRSRDAWFEAAAAAPWPDTESSAEGSIGKFVDPGHSPLS